MQQQDAFVHDAAVAAPDLARRFGGLERLYGVAGAARIRSAHVLVAGIGGVGSWPWKPWPAAASVP